MPRLCSDSSRPYPGRSVPRAMRSALRKIPERTTGKSRSRHIRMLSPGVSEPSIARKQRFLIAPCRATCQGDGAEVSRRHSSPMPGVMPGTW
jgi:hypothetical protein